MPRAATLTSAFEYFGAKVRNPRWSWSAVSDDGQTVVLTLWDDQLGADGSIDAFGHPKLQRWQTQTGNKFRIKDLMHARDHCDGKFRVVRVTAVDTDAIPRRIKQRAPDPIAVMQLTKLDEVSGEFAAKRVR